MPSLLNMHRAAQYARNAGFRSVKTSYSAPDAERSGQLKSKRPFARNAGARSYRAICSATNAEQKPLCRHPLQIRTRRIPSGQLVQLSVSTVGLTGWSVIMLFLFWPIAIYGFVCASRARNAATQEEAEKALKREPRCAALYSISNWLFSIYCLRQAIYNI